MENPCHFCDICKRPNHPFHGIIIGEEGFASVVRCKSHSESLVAKEMTDMGKRGNKTIS